MLTQLQSVVNVTSNRTKKASHIIQQFINLWTDEMWTAEVGAVSVTTIVQTAANWTKRSVQVEGEKIMSESHCVVHCIGLDAKLRQLTWQHCELFRYGPQYILCRPAWSFIIYMFACTMIDKQNINNYTNKGNTIKSRSGFKVNTNGTYIHILK